MLLRCLHFCQQIEPAFLCCVFFKKSVVPLIQTFAKAESCGYLFASFGDQWKLLQRESYSFPEVIS